MLSSQAAQPPPAGVPTSDRKIKELLDKTLRKAQVTENELKQAKAALAISNQRCLLLEQQIQQSNSYFAEVENNTAQAVKNAYLVQLQNLNNAWEAHFRAQLSNEISLQLQLAELKKCLNDYEICFTDYQSVAKVIQQDDQRLCNSMTELSAKMQLLAQKVADSNLSVIYPEICNDIISIKTFLDTMCQELFSAVQATNTTSPSATLRFSISPNRVFPSLAISAPLSPPITMSTSQVREVGSGLTP